jgi:hypothetical protein
MKPAVFVTDNFGDMSDESVPGEWPLLNVNRIIQGLWIGCGLSVMEQLSIASSARLRSSMSVNNMYQPVM